MGDWCNHCRSRDGRMKDPNRRWWQPFKTIQCHRCDNPQVVWAIVDGVPLTDRVVGRIILGTILFEILAICLLAWWINS